MNAIKQSAALATIPLALLAGAAASSTPTTQPTATCTTTHGLHCTGITGPEMNYSTGHGAMQEQFDQIGHKAPTTTWCTIASEQCGPLGLTQFYAIGRPRLTRPLGAR
jgi:hypothetical protein